MRDDSWTGWTASRILLVIEVIWIYLSPTLHKHLLFKKIRVLQFDRNMKCELLQTVSANNWCIHSLIVFWENKDSEFKLLWLKDHQSPLPNHNVKMIHISQKTAKNDSASLGVSPVTLMQDVNVLQQQLYGLHLDKILGKESVIEATDPQGSLPK